MDSQERKSANLWIPAFGDLCVTRIWWSKLVRRVGDPKLSTPRPHPWIPSFEGTTVVMQGSPFAGKTNKRKGTLAIVSEFYNLTQNSSGAGSPNRSGWSIRAMISKPSTRRGPLRLNSAPESTR